MKQALSLTSGTVFNYAHNIDGDYWQRDQGEEFITLHRVLWQVISMKLTFLSYLKESTITSKREKNLSCIKQPKI